ncbi:Splicing factor-like protein [Parasponia andersonii]|uniref:Splicing factor-like protein n=1 Tax=Parasponia andersonii TaxID=3476 RepID=A0A2P5C324_PARAD|nr:Splicing factor-like protein [Parasponia andersonii]
MEEEKEREREKVRIYVGGVGEGVREEELRRVFELAGGTVEAVDLIRTKGRSFAYVDFLPNSHKSLSNLFAKYNGCVWKGAKLRLEKAKQHYLLRLTREEWSESQSQSQSQQPEEEEAKAKANANSHSSSSSSDNNNNIRIFFPRLRKVKSLPFSGSGKHKYSFQRADLPSRLLPNYFCDCEQHSGPSSSSSSSFTRKEKQVCHVQVLMESQGGGGGGGDDGINQEELNIMNKVMNTLFQNQTDAPQFDDNDNANEQDEDEDDVILIVVVVAKATPTHTHNTASLRRHQLSKHQDVSKLKRGNDFESAISENEDILRTNSDKSGKPVEVQSWEPKPGKHKASDHVSWSQKSSWKKLVADKGINSFSIAGKLPDNASTEEGHPISETSNVADPDEENENLERDDELEEDTLCKRRTEELVEEAQPADQNVVSTQTGRGAYWRHKSSWTQLISENYSFSISQNFTGITSNQQVPTKPKDAGVVNSANGKLTKMVNSAKEDCPSVSEVRKEGEESRSTLEANQHSILGNNESSSPMLEEKCGVAAKQTSPVKVEISNTCTFMRSATSLKEWAKTKAALSGSLKRKGTPK